MEIVPMSLIHVPAVAALERQCFSLPWSESSIRGELDNPLSLWLVAVDGRQLLGYVGSQTVLGETDILNVAVAPSYRRQKIAARLLERLLETLQARGVTKVSLEVRVSNAGARALYQRLGFVQAGHRPNYYSRPKEDGLILNKQLGEI